MKEKIKILAKLIKENNASIEQQIEYYKLMIQITNSKTDAGSKTIERYSNKIEELKKQLPEVIYLPEEKKELYKTIKNLMFKRGDIIKATFKNGDIEEIKIKNIQFSIKQGKNNILHDNFNIVVDNNKYVWNIYKIKSIEILNRNNKSKNILLNNNKQFLFNCQ